MTADEAERRPRNDLFDATVQLLASRWRSAGPLWPGFALLAEGRPVEPARLAETCGLGIDELDKLLNAVRSRRDERGRLLDLFGMTLEPTQHQLTIDGAIVFACCALWSQVVPKLVGRTVTVESVDPVDESCILLVVSPDGVDSTDPVDAEATMAIATMQGIAGDVGAAFCSHVKHFRSHQNAERFARQNAERQVVSIAALDAIGRQLLTAIRAQAT